MQGGNFQPDGGHDEGSSGRLCGDAPGDQITVIGFSQNNISDITTNRRPEESLLKIFTPCWCSPGWLPRVTVGAACLRRTGRRPSPWRWRGEPGWPPCRPGRDLTLQTGSQCISKYLHFSVTVNFHSGLSRLQPKLYKNNIKPVIKEHLILSYTKPNSIP